MQVYVLRKNQSIYHRPQPDGRTDEDEGGRMPVGELTKKLRITCPCCSRLLCYITLNDSLVEPFVTISQNFQEYCLEIKCLKCKNIVKVGREKLLEL